MKFYGEANLQQNFLKQAVLPLDESFPATPVAGQLVFKSSILYICISITDNLPVWAPLTKELTSYTHTQATASSTWTINHGLNTRSVFVMVYDDADRVVIPDQIQVNGLNTVTVNLSSAATGRVVVLSGHIDGNSPPSYAYEHYQTTPSTTWTITHNLGRNPIVRIFVGNQEVQPLTTTFTSSNVVTVTFTTAQQGTAKLL